MVIKKELNYSVLEILRKPMYSISETYEADLEQFDNVEPKEFLLFIWDFNKPLEM